MLNKTGVPTKADIEAVFPGQDRLSLGPCAVIECFERIPCNPCATSCPHGAIQPFEDINDRPIINEALCNGCTLCLTKCPGLAIMVVDASLPGDKAVIKLPYEFRPLPEKGDYVMALDRQGNPVAEVEVTRVLLNHAMNKVPIVSILVDKEHIKEIRGIVPSQNKAAIVCRCNDFTIDDIKELIAKGITSVEEIKRLTRLGMGPCQGRSCIPTVLRQLSIQLGVPIEELEAGTYRPTVKSISLGDLAAYGQEEAHDE